MPQQRKRHPGNKGGYTRRYLDGLTAAYLAVVGQTDPDLAGLIARRLDLDGLDRKGGPSDPPMPEKKRRALKARRRAACLSLWNGLPEDARFRLAAEDAKINTLLRAAQTMAVTEVVQAHNAIRSTTAGSIDFVMRRFREESVAAFQLQQFLNENGVAWFSLTSHPTNPATVEYSLAEIEVSRTLADQASTAGDLEAALRAVRDAPVVGERKAPLDEVRETLGTLEVIYDVALRHKALFDEALRRYGYADEGVVVKRPLLRPCAWSDGDGNENITAEVLEQEVSLRRERIRKRYLAHLEKIKAAAPRDPKAERRFNALEATLSLIDGMQDRMPDRDGLLEQLADFASTMKGEAAQGLYDLAYLVDCFGFCFGTIDIRHNAADVTKAAALILDRAGSLALEKFEAMNDLERESALSSRLSDGDLVGRCAALDPAALGDATAERIVRRLKIVGRHPDICEKLIIAETASAAHALAGLFLLRVTGNEVATQKSRINLVTLSESVADLMSIGSLLESLLDNPVYRAHIASRGRLIAMIAKSDTTRLDGRGAAEYAQDEAAVAAYGVIDRLKGKYRELEYVQTTIMNGGGLALQRGGGRITEIPALHGRAAADARASDIGPSTLTVQGHQQRILFAPYKTAIGTLEALAAQNLYTKAGIMGEMPPPLPDRRSNRQYARADSWLFAKTAGAAYETLARDNPAIDELLVAAPWLSMKAGNVSSRPAKRGEKQAGPGITPGEARGKNPKALQGRAISGERLCAHACLPVYTVLGQKEGMEAVRLESHAALNPEKYGEPLHHLYRSNKIHRDGARVNINAAPLADFDLAWPLLAGRERPERDEVEALARRFQPDGGSGRNPPEITLAFLEDYFLAVEKLTFEMVTGQAADAGFSHGDGLKILWPELAEQVAYRNRRAEFARTVETARARDFNRDPDRPLSERDYRITQALYASADVIDAPSGILATRTRLDPTKRTRRGSVVLSLPQSFSESAVIDRLELPPCLAKFAC